MLQESRAGDEGQGTKRQVERPGFAASESRRSRRVGWSEALPITMAGDSGSAVSNQIPRVRIPVPVHGLFFTHLAQNPDPAPRISGLLSVRVLARTAGDRAVESLR